MKVDITGDMSISGSVFDVLSDICNSPMGERMVFRNDIPGCVLCTKANDGDAKLGAGSITMFMTIPSALMSFPGEHLCLGRMRTFIGNMNALKFYDEKQQSKAPVQKSIHRAVRNGREEVVYVKMGRYELATPIQRVEAFKAEGQMHNKYFWLKAFDRSSIEASRVATFRFLGDGDLDSLHSIAKKVVSPKELCIIKPSAQESGKSTLKMEFSSGSADSLSYSFDLCGDEVGPSYHEMIKTDEPIKFPFEVLKCAADAGMTINMKLVMIGGKCRLILEGNNGEIDIVFAVGEKK